MFSEWIKSVRDIMQIYNNKSETAIIEEKESMISWNYASADLEFGNWQAKELA